MTDRRKKFNSRFGGRFGAIRYRYSLSPFIWETNDPEMPHWRFQNTVEGGIDLRPIAAQAIAGGTPQGFAFVASTQPVSGNEICRAMHVDESTTSLMRDAWQSAIGYRPDGDNLLGMLLDQMTVGADPAGEFGPKPLIPTVNGMLELWLGGHSRVWSERFQWGTHPHTNQVQAVLQRDFERLWEALNGNDHCRRVLDWQCEKFKVNDWKQLVPRRLHQHVPGRLPHDTSISDNFNRANDTDMSVGAPFNWTDVAGAMSINTNRAMLATSPARSRAESALSGTDHYSQADLIRGSGSANSGHASVRYASGSDDCYTLRNQQGGAGSGARPFRISKVVTGTSTDLGSASTVSQTAPETMRLTCSGTSLTSAYNGADVETLTDSTHSTGTRCGVGAIGTTAWGVDNFSAEDLAVVTARPYIIGGGVAGKIIGV